MFVNTKALFAALLFFDNSFYLTSSFSHFEKIFPLYTIGRCPGRLLLFSHGDSAG
jgi:hypothetical protein